jgi:hypothetical protein
MELGEQGFIGYSGAGHTMMEGRNNPSMQNVQNKGPIPCGIYDIGDPHYSATTGPYTMNLDPTPETNTYGRSLFRIHGNNERNDASHGCIILPPDARRAVWNSGDHQVTVVP